MSMQQRFATSCQRRSDVVGAFLATQHVCLQVLCAAAEGAASQHPRGESAGHAASPLPPMTAMTLHFLNTQAHQERLSIVSQSSLDADLQRLNEPNWWRSVDVEQGVCVDLGACLPRLRHLRLTATKPQRHRDVDDADVDDDRALTLLTLASAARLKKLRILRIELSWLSDVNVLRISSSLVELDLAGTNVTDEGIQGLASIPTLEVVNLAGCKRVTDVTCLRHCSALRSIDVSSTSVTDSGIQGLEWIPSLISLSLAFCAAVRSVACLRVSKSLRELNLLGSSVSMAATVKLADALPSLRRLSLSWCGTVALKR